MNPTDAELEILLRSWWSLSYSTPPGPHALMTHLGWGRFLLEQVQKQQQEASDAA
jgi:hypothetical protein